MTGVARSQEEILQRIEAITAEGSDMFAFRRDVLVDGLDFDRVAPYIDDIGTAAEWDSQRWGGGRDVLTAAREYLGFAIGKIAGHRGISANRSVDKLGEYAWLLGRDDVMAAMDSAGYAQYGAPKVKAFADAMGWPWPADNAALARMAAGELCTDDCVEGCGR